nr:FtsX-like permease family protein [Clostridia bacterium]
MGIVLKWNIKTLLADKVRIVMAILCVIIGNATTIGLCALLAGFASGIGSLNTDDSLFRFLSVVFPPMSQSLMGLSMFAMFSVYLAESRQQRTLMYNVGATKKMLVRALLTEAFLLSLIGILAGSAAGLLIAWFQLGQMGISADLRRFLFSADGARCILPSLLIVPAAMLAAYARTAFVGNKKLPGKKRKAAFGGGLLNKLLGAGGRLGHARSSGGNPGGRPVVASVVAAFTLLFLMTTGLSIVGSTQSSFSEQDFINVYFWVSEDSLSDLP